MVQKNLEQLHDDIEVQAREIMRIYRAMAGRSISAANQAMDSVLSYLNEQRISVVDPPVRIVEHEDTRAAWEVYADTIRTIQSGNSGTENN